MIETKLFRSNKTQAVRLPKDVAFPDDIREVTIVKDGERRIIAPAASSWNDFFASPGIDLGHRDQPDAQSRESL